VIDEGSRPGSRGPRTSAVAKRDEPTIIAAKRVTAPPKTCDAQPGAKLSKVTDYRRILDFDYAKRVWRRLIGLSPFSPTAA
jgi:hypothetical protein